MFLYLFLVFGGGGLSADDSAYFVAPAAGIRWLEGAELGPHAALVEWRGGLARPYLGATGALEGAGELFLATTGEGMWDLAPVDVHSATLAIRIPRGSAARGVLFVPDESGALGLDEGLGSPTGPSFRSLRFELAPEQFTATREQFLRVRLAHDQRLQQIGAAGGAWWRMRAEQTRHELGESVPGAEPAARPLPWRRAEVDDTLNLFSGGRALAENLQLDRLILPGPGGAASVPIESLPGITTASLDWAALVEGRDPALDPLAAAVPEDQHGVFFPSLEAALDVLGECERNGSLWFDMAEPSSDDRHVRARYERQLCLPLGPLASALGKLAIKSVALTGSDPCFRTGTDLAVLLECSNPEMVEAFVAAQQAGTGAAEGRGNAGGVAWRSAASADDSVRSYVARAGDQVVVSNSLAQLERVLGARLDPARSLARSPEYLFFRDRYRRGEHESALVVLTDATIRRWCGPRWRIGLSRRTQAAAVLADLEMQRLWSRSQGPELAAAPLAAPALGNVVALEDGVRAPEWGSTRFLRPVIELDLSRVTPPEQEAYERYRVRYQSNWRQFFDPIALRLTLTPAGLSADLTVMPLIEGTEYRELTRWCGTKHLSGKSFRPEACLGTFSLALDSESQPFQEIGRWFDVAPSGGPNALSWIAGHLELWAEADPWWEEYAAKQQTGDGDSYMSEQFHRLPMAVAFPSKDPLRLAAFLSGLRALSDGAAPGLTTWETREYAGQAYVCIGPGESAGSMGRLDELRIYYAARPDALIVTLREDLLQRTLDRLAMPTGQAGSAPPWRRESAVIECEPLLLRMFLGLAEERLEETARAQAWAALPILNEWRRLFPDQDPRELYARTLGAGMLGGPNATYVWNENWRSFESVHCGLPQAPRPSLGVRRALGEIRRFAAGLTFERDGLRARVELERAER
jgi:hypothetical protein